MKDTGAWVLGAAVALLGLAALVLAGRAQDTVLYLSALGIFVFCVLYVLMLVKQAFDREHKDH